LVVSVTLDPKQIIPSLLVNPEFSAIVIVTLCCCVTVIVVVAVDVQPSAFVTVTV
jgi:hypothetical protein